jgi:hypothetical protein
MTSTRERQPSLVRMLRTCMRCDRRWSGARPPGGGHPRRPRSRRHAGASRRGRRGCRGRRSAEGGAERLDLLPVDVHLCRADAKLEEAVGEVADEEHDAVPTKPTAASVISPAPARSTPDTAGSGRVAIEVGQPFPAPCCRGRLQARSSRTAEHAGKKLPYSVPRLEPRTPRVATRSPTACPPAPCTWDTPGTAAGPGPAGTGDAQVDVL